MPRRSRSPCRAGLCQPGLLLDPGTPPQHCREGEIGQNNGKGPARAPGEHKSGHSCHQPSQSPAGVPGGDIRAGKHILFRLLEVPGPVEMNWPSVPSQARSGGLQSSFYTLPLPIRANKSQGSALVFPQSTVPSDSATRSLFPPSPAVPVAPLCLHKTFRSLSVIGG